MKIWIVILSALLMCPNLWAEKKKVELNKKVENQEKPNRSLVYELTAAIDGTNIIPYSDVAMEMSISIYDANDILVQTLSLTCTYETDFDLLLTSPGEYRIEISCGEDFYYGYFVLS